jgi:hypothetical protein
MKLLLSTMRTVRCSQLAIIILLTQMVLCWVIPACGQPDCSFEETPPFWEPLLWGGSPGVFPGRDEQAFPINRGDETSEQSSSHLETLSIRNIRPLYISPRIPDEGIWESKDLPTGVGGKPVMYKTTFRPSVQYPNAIVHMLLFDLRLLKMRLYLGSAEPGCPPGASVIDPDGKKALVAITNALWKQKHSRDGGTIFNSQVIKPLFPGMATLAVFTDGKIDIFEWDDSIPISEILYAKQLRHLIVKDGKVVTNVMDNGEWTDGEIGLGYLLSEEQPSWGYNPWGAWWGSQYQNSYYAPDWFIATRSAFGIRSDGNLVFVVGHHISTKDLAKALVLADCQRAIHADANPHNVVGNIYFRDETGDIKKKIKLSPDQRNSTLDRYVDKSYTSDFFGFFLKLYRN